MASKRRRAAKPDGAGADLADAEVPMGEEKNNINEIKLISKIK